MRPMIVGPHAAGAPPWRCQAAAAITAAAAPKANLWHSTCVGGHVPDSTRQLLLLLLLLLQLRVRLLLVRVP